MMMPVCKRCGEPIIGNYVEALSATWHPEHFVCAACGRPFEQARFIVHGNGDPYHEACYTERILPRCAYCNKPLAGEYLVDAWGTKYCKEHERQYPACEFCGRLIPPAQQEGGTDITRCAICRSSGIESAEVAKPLYAQVVRWVSGQGLRYNQMRLQLELCNRQRLAQLLQARSLPHALGATNSISYSRNGRIVNTEVQGIAVRLGLPAVLFQGTAVHELGHVWLIVQGINGLESWAEEGFCQLLAYRYYQEMHTTEYRFYADRIANDRDEVYGEGFRHVYALAQKHGFAQLLEILRSTKQLPR